MPVRYAIVGYVPTTDAGFLVRWSRGFAASRNADPHPRRANGRLKDFELFVNFGEPADRIRLLPPLACVIAFRQTRLLLRGIVDDTFVAHCLEQIPDGAEYLLREPDKQRAVNGGVC